MTDTVTTSVGAMGSRFDDIVAGTPVTLSGSDLRCPGLTAVLGTVGLDELAFTSADVERSAGRVAVTGDATVFGFDGVTSVVEFTDDTDAVDVDLHWSFPESARLALVGLDWATLGDLEISASARDADLPLPVTTFAVAATATVGGTPVRIAIRPGIDDWALSASDIRLPDLATLATLLGVADADGLLPPGVPDLSAARLALGCRLARDDWQVRSVQATIDFPGRVWTIGDGLPTLRDVRAGIGVTFVTTDDVTSEEEASATLDTPIVTAEVRATVKYGTLELPARVALEVDSWRLGILGAHGFPSFGELLQNVAGKSAAAMLPTGLAALQIDTATVDLALARKDGSLRSFFFDIRLADHWPIIDGHLALDHVAAQLSVDRVSGTTSGFVDAVIDIEGFQLPVDVSKPDSSSPWTLTLGAAAGRSIDNLSSLDGLVGGDKLAEHLPTGLGGSGVSLDDLTIAFDPDTNAISSVALALHVDGPWSPPGLDQFDVRDISVDLRVTAPADSAKRAVTGSLAGTIDVGGASITMRASKPSAEADWEIEGSLVPGSTPLQLSSMCDRMLPTGMQLPAGMPNPALTAATVTATPATGAFDVRVSSSGAWLVPIGVGGLSVGDVFVNVTRKDGSVAAVVGGHVRFDTADAELTCVIGDHIELTTHIERLRLVGLLESLLGDGSGGHLALPAPVENFELTSLDLRVAPAIGLFSATAKLPGFDVVSVQVSDEEGGWVFCGVLAPAADWRLSSLSRSLAVFDKLSFGKCLLVVSTGAVPASVKQLDVVRTRLGDAATDLDSGLTFLANLDLRGTGVDELTGIDSLLVRAAIAADLSSVALAAELSGEIELAKGVHLKHAKLQFRSGTSGVEAGVFGEIDAVIGGSTLKFIGGVAVTPNGFTLAVTMLGTWDQPFGLSGVSVSNTALTIGASFEGVPTVGFAGSVMIGTFHGDIAVLFRGDNPAQSALVVRFDSLKLADVLVALCHEVFQDAVPEDLLRTIFDITFSDVEIYVVPIDTEIGEIELKAGTRLKARMVAWGLHADASLEIDYAKGIKAHAEVDPITFAGIFALRGTGGYPKPMMDFEVTTGKLPSVIVEGEVELLGLVAHALVTLTDTSFQFEVGGSIFDLFECDLKVAGGHLDNANGIAVSAYMRNDLIAYLREHAVAGLKQAADDAASAIAGARKDVANAQGDVDKLNTQIDARRRTVLAQRDDTRRTMTNAQTAVVQTKQGAVNDLDRQITDLVASISAQRTTDAKTLTDAQADLRDKQRAVDSTLAEANRQRVVVQGERDLANRRMQAAQDDVDAAQRNVDSIISTINRNAAWWNSLPAADWPWKESQARAATWYGPMIAGLWVGYGTATGALKVATGVLDGIKAGATYTPIDMDPRVTGPLAAYGLATAGLATAEGFVEAAQALQQFAPIDADPRLIALRGSRDVAALALDTAIGGLGVIQSGLDLPPVDMDPVIVALVASRETAHAALVVADGILATTSDVVGGALAVSEFLVSNALGGLFDVREASFEGSLDVVSSGSVHMSLTIELMGIPHTLAFGFEFHSLAETVERLVKDLLDLADAA